MPQKQIKFPLIKDHNTRHRTFHHGGGRKRLPHKTNRAPQLKQLRITQRGLCTFLMCSQLRSLPPRTGLGHPCTWQRPSGRVLPHRCTWRVKLLAAGRRTQVLPVFLSPASRSGHLVSGDQVLGKRFGGSQITGRCSPERDVASPLYL